MNAMRNTKRNGWDVLKAAAMLLRGVRLAAVATGVAVVLSAGMARAQDDDNATFEEKIITKIMHGLGATNMDNSSIEYRERSPLVIPPSTELPPPGSGAAEVRDPNWPKDPDVERRREAAAARKDRKPLPWQGGQSLGGQSILPSKLAPNGSPITATKQTEMRPLGTADNVNPSLSPSQLGFAGKLSNLFGGNKTETAPFTGEPDREKLTQPPVGYQTPSPNYAYGTGPKEALGTTYIDVNSGKERTY
ncbi:hypothetical protein NB311A_14607 [Nitrobacter sp. Nb-311A]|nr:hypothetical protein NB311A_14607 [Nitrobacter sp. Nb-311A]